MKHRERQRKAGISCRIPERAAEITEKIENDLTITLMSGIFKPFVCHLAVPVSSLMGVDENGDTPHAGGGVSPASGPEDTLGQSITSAL